MVNTSWLIGERIFNTVVGLPIAILVARSLGPEAFGRLSYALSLVYFTQGAATLGLQGLVVRDLVAEPEARRRVLSTVFLLRLTAGAGLWVLVVAASAILAGEINTDVALVALVGLSLITQAFATVDLFFQASEEVRFSVLARLTGSATDAGLKLVLILMAAPVLSFGGAVGVAAVATAAAFFFLARARGLRLATTRRASGALARSLLSRSWYLVISGLGAALYLRMDQVMLRHMRSADAVGVYAAAAVLGEAWLILPAAALTAIFPRLVRARSDGGGYERSLHEIFAALFLLGLVCASAGTLVSPWLFPTLYGDAYQAAAPVFSVYVWGTVFLCVRLGVSRWLVMEDLLHHSLTTHGLGAATNLVLNFVLIPEYGTIGAAWATVCSYFVAGYGALLVSRQTRPLARLILIAAVRSPVEVRGLARSLRSRNGSDGSDR